ncbi:TonB-dependent receptor [Aureisphaera galaxeae]|uniref:SusC/RagA family TonB-linked outer membrane protein n=1 Tax=Aureisphaera galaxeae TaxID=1538023 RepID=UPI00234FDE53|nr:TonB-dependent receptor [Aureisphaera galaxeae]MDC8005157.1 TonB-dependent receptor [Aureisphaera galaxeae]
MRNCFFFLCAFLAISVSFGQSFSVSGTVLDRGTNEPLLSASVVQKGTNNGVTTDFDGNFTINDISSGDVLVISYLGFVTQEVTVASDTAITIYLEEDIASLDEIVVIGYGAKRKKEITGAVAVISSETIEELKPARIEQALQGQISGVQITSQSGSPGSALDIRIRGISTNGDNRPLILVDGNVIEDLSVLNPGDIETINVLKDATAGIYGVRAANGVVLITTKTGRKQSPITIEYDAYGGIQETTRSLPTLNATEYALLANEAFAANGEPILFNNINGLGRGTDWQSEVFSRAPILNNSVTMRGGSKKSTYSAGASLLTQDGIVGGDKANFTRYTARLNYNTDLLDNLKFKSSLIYTGTKRKTLQENAIGSVLYNALNMDPILLPRTENGFSRAENLPIEVINPLAQIESTFNNTKVDRISGVFGLNYNFLDNFSAEVNYQWNYSEVRGRFYFPVADFGVQGVSDKVFDRDVSVLVENTQFFRDYTFDAFISYDNTFWEDHKVNLTVGTSVFKTTGDTYSITGINLPDVGFAQVDINDAETIVDNFMTRSNRVFDSRLLSYFGRLQYDYKGKYLFSAVVRRDGSTAFGPDNKFGIFPSFSAGWIVSDENFMSDSNIFNFLKLRGSYGIIGNDRIPAFGFASLLNGEGVYVFDDELEFGTAIGAISNPEIKWEEQQTLDVGLDARFLQNKLSLEVDYFNRETKDLLLVVQTSGTTGSTGPGSGNPLANAGTVRNTGFEMAVGYQDKLSPNFSFNVNFNATWLDNEVLSVNNGIGFEPGGAFGIGQAFPARMEEGFPLGYYYGFETDGLFQNIDEVNNHPSQIALGAEAQPGDIRFVDQNGDGVINEEDRTNIGDPIPDVTLGLNLSFEYKNLDFRSYFFASIGNDIVRNYERNHPRTNRTTNYLDRWTGAGTSNDFPRVTTGATSNLVFSDFYVEDGSFIRAQNMQLGYSLSEKALQQLRLAKLRFYVSVSNAFTLTKYRGYDPTVSTGAPIGGGFDQGLYPTPRTYLLGVNLKI